MEGSQGGGYKIAFGDKVLFAAQQLYTKLDFDVLWFRRRRAYNIEKEKKRKTKRKKGKKKEKNHITAKSGLVGMKEYLKTYNLVKYFLAYLRR